MVEGPFGNNNAAPRRTAVPGYVKLLGLAALAVVLLLMANPFTIVPGGSRGVVLTAGKIEQVVLDEGLHVVIPFVQTVKKISVRVDKEDIKTNAASKDLQTVDVSAIINWSLSPESVAMIYQKYGDLEQVNQRFVTPISQSVIKTETAKRNAEELLQQRQQLQQSIEDGLRVELAKEKIILSNVSLTNIQFSQEFNHAIEAKQVAQQQAQQAYYLAEKAKNEANALREQARGQADAQKLIVESLDDKILRRMWIEKWDGKLPTVVTNGSSLLQIPTDGKDK